MATRLTVNQRVRDIDAAPETPLLYVLSNELALAIANAFFDATGVRLREHPMTPPRVLAALQRT